ncbi:MAG: MEDS domain-containing protein [Thermodesulfobacteriota bacterium]
MSAFAAIPELAVGDHLCCLYRTEQEHQNILVPFIRDAVDQGDKVLYVVDARTADTILAALQGKGIDTEGLLAAEQLVITGSRQTYLKHGRFDPDAMLDMLEAETQIAVRQGFRALRVTGEMSWALRGLPGSERLMEYEGKLNEFFPTHQALGMCQYDMRSFAPEILLDVLATHPIAVIGDACYENMYYMPPEEFLGPNRAQAELERRIQNLEQWHRLDQERGRIEEELRRSEATAKREAAFTNAILDTAGALIVVLDPKGRILRFNHTCERLSGYAAQEVVGTTVWEALVSKRDVGKTRAVFQELSQGQMSNRFENEWVSKKGERIRVAWANTSLIDERGNVEFIVSTGLDITEVALVERAQTRELQSLESYSGKCPSSLTAASFGLQTMQQAAPAAFSESVQELVVILEQAMEQNIYRVEHDITTRLRRLAEHLGHYRARPRDLVQAYVQALSQKTEGQLPQKARAYTEEGRLLLVELMGFLATFYFNQCLGKDENATEGMRGAS